MAPLLTIAQKRQNQGFSPLCGYSDFLAPSEVNRHQQIFNHLIQQFSFTLRNNPQTIFDGRISTQGRIQCAFDVFGAVALLFVEIKPNVPNHAERLEAIAQLIADCISESQHFSLTLFLDLLDVQAATPTTDLWVIPCLSTAFTPTVGPSNFSSTRESQIQCSCVAVSTEIQSTSSGACEYLTLVK
jgi:hypothetical protein